MKFKFLTFGICIILLNVLVVADECPGSVSLNNNLDFSIGQTISVLVTTTISHTYGRRNIDLVVTDPKGLILYRYAAALENDTYALQAQMNVTNSFLRGNYKTKATITVLNSSNLQQTLCEEAEEDTFSIETNRTSYNDIIIQITPDFEREIVEYNLCENITVKDISSTETVVYPLCVQGIFPKGFNVGFRRFIETNLSVQNISNVSLLIEGKEPMYPYSVLESLHSAWKQQSSNIDILMQKYERLENLSDMNARKMATIEFEMNETIYGLQQQIFYYQRMNENLTRTLSGEVVGVKATEVSLRNPYLTFILGILAVILYSWWRVKRKQEKLKE